MIWKAIPFLSFLIVGLLAPTALAAPILVDSSFTLSVFREDDGLLESGLLILGHDAENNLIAGVTIGGDIGGSSVYTVAPDGSLTLLISEAGLTNPFSIAHDSAENIYVSDFYFGARKVVRRTLDGTISTFATFGTNISQIAFDSLGNLFVVAFNAGSVFSVAPDGTISTFLTGLVFPQTVALDQDDNLYVGVQNDNGSFLRIAPDTTITTIATNVNSLLNGSGFSRSTFDSQGNLFVMGGGNLIRLAPDNAVSVVATNVPSYGLTVDANDNIIISNVTTNTIYQLTPEQQAIPEPGTLALVGLGVLGLARKVRRRRR